MTWAYKASSSGFNGGDATSTSATVTLTTAPAAGDLVVAWINRNTDVGINNDAGGAAWTQEKNEGVTSETARIALFWKVAGASEPSTYTFTFASGDDYYQMCVMTFSSTTDAQKVLVSGQSRQTSGANMFCGAANGTTVNSGELSIIGCGMDNRSASGADYTVADNGFTPIGEPDNQATALAYKIHSSGETLGDVTITGTSPSDATYSIHIVFEEGAAGPSLSIPIAMYHRRQFNRG